MQYIKIKQRSPVRLLFDNVYDIDILSDLPFGPARSSVLIAACNLQPLLMYPLNAAEPIQLYGLKQFCCAADLVRPCLLHVNLLRTTRMVCSQTSLPGSGSCPAAETVLQATLLTAAVAYIEQALA